MFDLTSLGDQKLHFFPPHRMKLFPGIPTPITKTSPRSSTLFAALVLPLFLTLLGMSVAQPVQHGAEAADNDDAASSAYWKRAGFVGMRDGVQNAGMRAGKLVRAHVVHAGVWARRAVEILVVAFRCRF